MCTIILFMFLRVFWVVVVCSRSFVGLVVDVVSVDCVCCCVMLMCLLWISRR